MLLDAHPVLHAVAARRELRYRWRRANHGLAAGFQHQLRQTFAEQIQAAAVAPVAPEVIALKLLAA